MLCLGLWNVVAEEFNPFEEEVRKEKKTVEALQVNPFDQEVGLARQCLQTVLWYGKKS